MITCSELAPTSSSDARSWASAAKRTELRSHNVGARVMLQSTVLATAVVAYSASLLVGSLSLA
jgi:hypothetical protein